MRIALAYFERFIEMSGGIERVCCNMANAMAERGHEVSVIYCYGRSGQPFYPLDPSVKSYNLMAQHPEKWKKDALGQCVSGRDKLIRELIRVFNANKARDWNENVKGKMIREEIRKAVDDVRPDIIISFRYETSNYLINFAHVQVPMITMFHIDPAFIMPKMPEGEIRAVGKSAVAQVLLPHDVKVVNKYCPDANVVWIPNVVPQYDRKADLSAEKKTYTIINAARLNKAQKQQHLLVDAFAKIAADFPDWTVELWGGGDESGVPYAEELRKQIRGYGLEKRVFLKGESSHIIDEYLKADIFCFPSAYEGFGLSMAEAMSAGLPAVVFKSCTAAASLIQDGETGLLADDGAEGLAQKLKQLMSNREKRAKMGSNARKSMEEYRPEHIWDMWEQLITQTVSEGRASERSK